MCLGNHNNQFGGIRVFLNFGVIYEGSEEPKREMEDGEKVLNSTLAGIQVCSQFKSLGQGAQFCLKCLKYEDNKGQLICQKTTKCRLHREIWKVVLLKVMGLD